MAKGEGRFARNYEAFLTSLVIADIGQPKVLIFNSIKIRKFYSLFVSTQRHHIPTT